MSAGMPDRFAIATLWDGRGSYECALPIWCKSAHQLSAAAAGGEGGSAEVVVISPQNMSMECPNARFVWRNDTLHALQVYVSRVEGAGSDGKALRDGALLKWSVFALTDYAAVLYADLDVDLFPPGMVVRAEPGTKAAKEGVGWSFADAARGFLASGALIVGAPDYASPINTGLFFAKPQAWLHQAALRCMRRCSWSRGSGFDGVGSPREIMKRSAAWGALLAQLQAGADLTPKETQAYIDRTSMQTGNNWGYVGGSIDQGMFWHLLYLRHGVGSWAALRYPRHPYYAEHFWSSPKPWRREGMSKWHGDVYLRRQPMVGLSQPTRCVAKLMAMRRTINAHVRNSTLGRHVPHWFKFSRHGMEPWRHPLLPSPRLAASWRARTPHETLF